jgi:hypothetical protein
VIDAGVYVEFGETRIDMVRPALAPILDKRRAVPVSCLAAETVRADLAQAEHDMGVGLGLSIRAFIPMHIEIGDHAARDGSWNQFGDARRRPAIRMTLTSCKARFESNISVVSSRG